MRNGNKERKLNYTQCLLSSYRTYEEWKLSNIIFTRLSTASSYRTYEEWKPVCGSKPYNLILRSYRTYEEWKQTHFVSVSPWRFEFLPYLWGMETLLFLLLFLDNFRSYRTYEEWKHFFAPGHCLKYWVLTVPMRNGNQQPSRQLLWQQLRSYRTYEEWKRGRGNDNGRENKVLTVPMRNGNLALTCLPST